MSDWSKSSKDTFNRITNPDGTPVRDKDNALPVSKPNYSRRPAPNLAPAGASGIKQRSRATNLAQGGTSEIKPYKTTNNLVPKLSKEQKAKVERITFTKTNHKGRRMIER